MHRRQPLPRLWLMTDERQGERLWTAIEKLPRGSGIVFRHYRLEPSERRRVFEKVRRVAARRRLLLILAGPPSLALAWRADGAHGRSKPGAARNLIQTAPAHDVGELRAAERGGAHLVFLSPVYATRSHPKAKPLGRLRFAMLARGTRLPVIALGGVTQRRARTLPGTYGWAGIDAWT